VQDRRAERLHVHAQLGQDAGHGHGMGDVGLAGAAGLAGMGLGADFISPADQLHLGRRKVLGQLGLERAHGLRAGVGPVPDGGIQR